jgi:hypothetical protein
MSLTGQSFYLLIVAMECMLLCVQASLLLFLIANFFAIAPFVVLPMQSAFFWGAACSGLF